MSNTTTYALDLPGLDGANPLGFLAAVGTLAVLAESNLQVKLGWRSGARWMPYLTSPQPLDNSEVLQRIAKRLRGKSVDAAKKKNCETAQRQFDDAKTRLKNAEKRFKARGLRGKARDVAREQDIVPVERALDAARREWLAALKGAVPSPELALGKRPDCTVEEFRSHARSVRADSAPSRRCTADMLASFGAELGAENEKQIVATPFCFITGSGHQWFLDTAGDLMARANETKLREALFERWAYRDEKLTMRWDPSDDRRYALMDRDPTAADNKSATVWMANLLAYIALAFFPCAPTTRGAATACWLNNKESLAFRWPVWRDPLSCDSIRSLLAHRGFATSDFAGERAELRARGVEAIFSARRIQVGNPPLHKINFASAVGL
jgi:hypothetical protein